MGAGAAGPRALRLAQAEREGLVRRAGGRTGPRPRSVPAAWVGRAAPSVCPLLPAVCGGSGGRNGAPGEVAARAPGTVFRGGGAAGRVSVGGAVGALAPSQNEQKTCLSLMGG